MSASLRDSHIAVSRNLGASIPQLDILFGCRPRHCQSESPYYSLNGIGLHYTHIFTLPKKVAPNPVRVPGIKGYECYVLVYLTNSTHQLNIALIPQGQNADGPDQRGISRTIGQES